MAELQTILPPLLERVAPDLIFYIAGVAPHESDRLRRLALSDAAAKNRAGSDFLTLATRQDQAPFRPHITIQNKAEPQEARLLLEQLQLKLEPFHVVEVLLLWRYLGGPWELIDRFTFDAP